MLAPQGTIQNILFWTDRLRRKKADVEQPCCSSVWVQTLA